jgi:hypothetical protein
VAPEEIVIHGTLDVADQEQVPAEAVTCTVPLFPAAGAVADVLSRVNVQGAVPACVTVKVTPATVRVPVRDCVPV